MEIYALNNWIQALFVFFGGDFVGAVNWGALGGLALWAILFTFQGIGLAKMAKKRGMKRRWLAFVPFANILYMGKLAGDCFIFNQRVKRAGLYVMLAQIVATLVAGCVIASEIYLYNAYGAPIIDPETFSVHWQGIEGSFSRFVLGFYELSNFFFPILQLVYEVLMLVLLLGLYRRYCPKNYVPLGFLALFVPMSRFFVIFAIRNRKEVDYDAYVRARREAYMRQQQQYQQQYQQRYGNPYGNPYGSPYGNPYGQSTPPRPEPPKEPDEPFEEFSSGKPHGSSGGDTSSSDDFFG